jgi:hypothetical protein
MMIIKQIYKKIMTKYKNNKMMKIFKGITNKIMKITIIDGKIMMILIIMIAIKYANMNKFKN